MHGKQPYEICIRPQQVQVASCAHKTMSPCKFECALPIRWWRAKQETPSVADPISSPSISSSSMTSPVVVTISITDQQRSAPVLSSRPAELQRRLLVTLVTVIFYYYPSLLTTSLSLFACYRIDPLEAQMGQNYPQNAQARAYHCLLFMHCLFRHVD